MRKVIVYAAVSLDGFIADSSGGVGWLEQPEGTVRDDGYSRFIETVDTVVMGARTYRQVVTELSPEAWPYRGLTTYVLTHTPDNAAPQADIRFVSRPPASLLEELVNLPGKDIWICGGADIIRQCRETDRIDVRMLMLDIISLNVFPFIAFPVVEPILGDLSGDRSRFFELRRSENVEIVLRRLKKS